jgi:hypothetical protein
MSVIIIGEYFNIVSRTMTMTTKSTVSKDIYMQDIEKLCAEFQTVLSEFYDNVTVTPKKINIPRILISGTYRKTNTEWYKVIEFDNIYWPFTSFGYDKNISICSKNWSVKIIFRDVIREQILEQAPPYTYFELYQLITLIRKCGFIIQKK